MSMKQQTTNYNKGDFNMKTNENILLKMSSKSFGTIIDTATAYYLNLDNLTYRVLDFLLAESGNGFRGVNYTDEVIGQILGSHPSTINAALKILEDKGLIERDTNTVLIKGQYRKVRMIRVLKDKIFLSEEQKNLNRVKLENELKGISENKAETKEVITVKKAYADFVF